MQDAMQALLVSTGVVALAEIGDKTQLLALVLAARWRKPIPIILGILVATILNHALAGAVGAWLAAAIGPQAMRWILGLSFLAMAAWILVPDKADDGAAAREPRYGVFLATLVTFFLVEMGDKTQIATVALGAQYQSVWTVAAGTTLGMMIANTPAVLLGEALVERVSLAATRTAAALLFLALGLWQLAAVAGLV
jgi:putative Ca2+/H+ antiporter (TMEM165/GDT1 family)